MTVGNIFSISLPNPERVKIDLIADQDLNDFDKKILVKRWEAIADGLCDAAVATQTYPTITNGRTRINRMPSRIPILLPPRHGSRQATTRV